MKAFKIFLCLFVYFFAHKEGNGEDYFKISGETSYSKSTSEKISSSLTFEYHFELYEPKTKKWGIHLSGKIIPLYDFFGNEIKTDTFTVIGINF